MSAAASASTSKQADAPAARPRLNILAEESVYILETHFDAQRRGILEQTANDLGAATTHTRADATIVIVNPRHHTYRQELDAVQRTDSDRPKPTLIPYHWLAACRIAGARLDPTSLESPVPYFVHPDRSAEHQPLRAWVSVNIHRGTNPGPHEAKRAVQDMLELGGCVITERRAVADLLVVDKASKFYEGTVLVEVKNGSRTWQRIVERDWVEACVKQGKMQWPARGWSERNDATDSMEEDDPATGRGPGRPKGKPRVEYTPEEDDFLCRYLAAWHPDGSWLSRKTFEIMVKRKAEFPIVERHSAQSWHERFKKNSGALSNRVNRYMHAGIREKDLKTDKEVEHAKQAEASAAASASTSTADRRAQPRKAQAEKKSVEVAQPSEGSTEAAPTSRTQAVLEAAPTGSDAPEHTTVAEREGARLTQLAAQAIEGANNVSAVVPKDTKGKKQLVTAASDSEDGLPGPSQRRKTPLPAEREGSVGPKNSGSTGAVAPAVAQLSTADAQVLPPTSTTGPEVNATSESAPTGTSLQASAAVSPKPLSDQAQSVTERLPATAAKMDPLVIDQSGSGQGEDARAMVANKPTSSTSVGAGTAVQRNPTPPEVMVQVVTIPADGSASSATDNEVVKRPHEERTLQSRHALALPASPRAESRSPKKVRLDIEPSPERQALPSPAASASRDGSPSHFLVRDIRDITKPTRPRQSLPAHLAGTPERIAHPRFSTPILTPRKRSLMQDHMLSSEKKKRRQSLDPAQAIARQPDFVLASTTFPPARIQDPNAAPPPPIIPRLGIPPPMTQEERHNRILSGQAVALRHRDEYKRHVTQLCGKYGISPRDVSDFVNAMPKRRNATGELYWRDVDAGLHERFAGVK